MLVDSKAYLAARTIREESDHTPAPNYLFVTLHAAMVLVYLY